VTFDTDAGQATQLDNAPLPIHSPLVEDLLVMYAFDLSERFEFLNQREASELNLSPLESHAVPSRDVFLVRDFQRKKYSTITLPYTKYPQTTFQY
jgi:hypothetical protein